MMMFKRAEVVVLHGIYVARLSQRAAVNAGYLLRVESGGMRQLLQPLGQRMDGVGQSKRVVVFVCDMERKGKEPWAWAWAVAGEWRRRRRGATGG
jgi:hypothetical protein